MPYRLLVKQTPYGELFFSRLCDAYTIENAFLTVGELASKMNMPLTHNFRRNVEDCVERGFLRREMRFGQCKRWEIVYCADVALDAIVETGRVPF